MFFARTNLPGAADGESETAFVRQTRRACAPEIILDLSRLLSRLLHSTPTGVDRVELAYARTLMRRIPDRLVFGAVHPCGLYGRLPRGTAERFLDATAQRWELEGGLEKRSTRWAFALAKGFELRPRTIPPPTRPRVLVQASPHHLDRPGVVQAKLAREQASFICLVHDLIPVTHPEYARRRGAARHARRLDTLCRHADGLLTNSWSTATEFANWAGPEVRKRPLRPALLGCDRPGPVSGRTPFTDSTYFLSIGTIEPRKNHLLLLNIWRSLVEMLGTERTPKLLIVGRRGWENENVLDLLDRCPRLKHVVIELPRLPDSGVRPLVRDARAVLMPSFAEGFGMPIAEALAIGAPVLASDLPAHREVGGEVPEYLDPIDGQAWRDAILDYCARASTRRRAQLDRLADWTPVSWDEHIDAALSLADEIAGTR